VTNPDPVQDEQRKNALTLAVILALQAVEDEIHDARDSPQTPPTQLPGLRRASRILRDTRQTIQDNETGLIP
jgi:hypothetical protein